MVGIRRVTGATPIQFSMLVGLVMLAWTAIGVVISWEGSLFVLAGLALLSGGIATIPAAATARRSGYPRLAYAGFFVLTAVIVASLVSTFSFGNSLGVSLVDSSLFLMPTLIAVFVYQIGLRASNDGIGEALPGMTSGNTIQNISVGTLTLVILLFGTLFGSGLVYGMVQDATGIDGNYYSAQDAADERAQSSTVVTSPTPVQTETATPTSSPTPTEALPQDLVLENITLANQTTWFDAGYQNFEALRGTTYRPEDNPSVYFEVSGVGYEKTGKNQYRVNYEYTVTLRDLDEGDSNTTRRSVDAVLTRKQLQQLWHGESFYIYYVFAQGSSYPYEFEIEVVDNITGKRVSKTVEFVYAPG